MMAITKNLLMQLRKDSQIDGVPRTAEVLYDPSAQGTAGIVIDKTRVIGFVSRKERSAATAEERKINSELWFLAFGDISNKQEIPLEEFMQLIPIGRDGAELMERKKSPRTIDQVVTALDENPDYHIVELSKGLPIALRSALKNIIANQRK